MSSALRETVPDLTRPPDRERARPGLGEPSFDVEELTAYLEGGHAALKARLRAVLGRPEFAYRYDIDRTQYRELVLARCRELAEHGFGGLLFPDGGSDVPSFLAVFETLGFGDPNLAIKFGLQFGLFGGAILYLGSKRHHEEYLPRVASMDLIGCYAMTEIGHGSDTHRLETEARYDPATREFVIDTPVPSGRKQFIGNAGLHARMAVVFAQLVLDDARPGVFAFLVPIRSADGTPCPGVFVGDTGPKAGLLGIDNGWLRFEGVRIPRENMLDRFGTVSPEGRYHGEVEDPTVLMQRTMSGGRVAIGLAALSAARAGLTIAVRYAARRRQFGRSEEHLLLDYPLHRRRLFPRLASAYAIGAALHVAMARSAESAAMTDEHFEELAALLKTYATWEALDTLGVCREACGGQGYLAPNRLGPARADIDPMTTLEGDNALLYMFCAKLQLTRLGRRLSAGGLRALLAVQAAARCEKTALALALRARGASRLRDPGFLLRLARFREDALRLGVARRLRAARRDGGRDYQTPLLELAQASAERIALESFTAQVAGSPHGARAALALLRDLYALGCLERHLAWYLKEGLLRAAHARRIDALVAEMCHQLRPHALDLVDAFAIPDECLGAPIARYDTLGEI